MVDSSVAKHSRLAHAASFEPAASAVAKRMEEHDWGASRGRCSGSRRRLLVVALLAGLSATTHLPAARAMACYRCTVLPPQYAGEKDQLCSKFDGSSSFYQDCPKSTFCVKRIIHYRLSNGSVISAYERDCAPQKYVFQEYGNDDRRWHSREKIDTAAYSEGCFRGENRGTPNGPSEYCYCSSNYCNASTSSHRESLAATALLVAAISLSFFSSFRLVE